MSRPYAILPNAFRNTNRPLTQTVLSNSRSLQECSRLLREAGVDRRELATHQGPVQTEGQPDPGEDPRAVRSAAAGRHAEEWPQSNRNPVEVLLPQPYAILQEAQAIDQDRRGVQSAGRPPAGRHRLLLLATAQVRRRLQ